jgi:hypothetical protein
MNLHIYLRRRVLAPPRPAFDDVEQASENRWRVTGRFKYSVDHTRIGNCPPSNTQAMKATVFRWVFKPDPKEESFKPQAKKDPARKWRDADHHCCGMGLSMNVTDGGARNLYAALRQRQKINVVKVLGTHLAAVALTPAHGLCDEPDDHGHFNLHEYVGVDLQPVSRIVGPA